MPVPQEDAARPELRTAVMAKAALAPLDDLEPPPALLLPAQETYYKSSELEIQPRPLASVEPKYPPYVFANNVQGWVRILLLIDERGVVRHVEVVEASSQGVFDEAALSAFRVIPFEPGRRNGQPAKSRMLVKVDFSLQGLSNQIGQVQ